MGKLVKITLSVQASSLYAISNPTRAQIDSHCSISDDNLGSSSDGTIENFQSNVYLNNNVQWLGATSGGANDNGYNIAITSIVYEATGTDVNFFNSTTINGTSGRSGNVTALVQNESNLVGQIDQYTINFDIYPPGNGAAKSCSIDPKLRANT